MRTAAALLCAGLAAGACTPAAEAPRDETAPRPSAASTPTPTPTESDPSSGTPTPDVEAPTRPIGPDDLDLDTALETVRHLAGVIGPRETTSPAFGRAADWVEDRFDRLGYTVQRQRIDVPAGTSWDGSPVAAGPSLNVIASPPGFDPEQPHLVVGAHLDTVARAPGAEDNASGIGVMLAAARATADHRTRLPVVFVAFGAEEPRGVGDDDHHYGSRTYVAALSAVERRAVRGMVSLDRVGVGAEVPIGSAGDSDPVQRGLLAAAGRLGIRAIPDADQKSSDHWSFVRAGLPAARLGSTPYSEYHSISDVPAVVQPEQLERVGRIVLEWLAPAPR